jgi:hypothetical protein
VGETAAASSQKPWLRTSHPLLVLRSKLAAGVDEALPKAWAGPGQHLRAPSTGAEQDAGTDLRPWPWCLDACRAGCALRRRRTQALRRGR